MLEVVEAHSQTIGFSSLSPMPWGKMFNKEILKGAKEITC
jgi:hypothetical protein